jgi:ABC-2 type transport system permease protein
VSLLRAELLKAFSTRLLLWYALGLLALLVFVLSTRIGSDNVFSLSSHSTQRSLMESAGLASVLCVLAGTVLVTAEYAHGTINQSFLAVPVRERLLAAKLVAAVCVALVLALLADALTLLIADLWYEGRGLSLELGGGTTTPLLGTIGASALAAGIGVGFGALLRRQTTAVVLILVWLLIGEAAINVIGDDARYAPGHALAGVIVAHQEGSGRHLGVWTAAATALVYAVIFGAAGLLSTLASDVPSSGE